MPFLARLALDPRTLQRDVIVHLLVALAIGYDEAYQPAGVDVAGWRSGVERSPAPVRPRLDPGRPGPDIGNHRLPDSRCGTAGDLSPRRASSPPKV